MKKKVKIGEFMKQWVRPADVSGYEKLTTIQLELMDRLKKDFGAYRMTTEGFDGGMRVTIEVKF